MWTPEQVSSLAPDPVAAEAAAGLAVAWKWSGLGCQESMAWGFCRGSRPQPYRTMASLDGRTRHRPWTDGPMLDAVATLSLYRWVPRTGSHPWWPRPWNGGI